MLVDPIVDDLTPEQWEEERKKAELDYKLAKLEDGSLFLEENDGITETLHFDEVEQTFTIKRVEDVESVMDWCRAHYNEVHVNKHNEFRFLGRYPITIAQVFAKKWGFPNWQECLKHKDMFYRLISDRDLSKFRTVAGNYTRRGY